MHSGKVGSTLPWLRYFAMRRKTASSRHLSFLLGKGPWLWPRGTSLGMNRPALGSLGSKPLLLRQSVPPPTSNSNIVFGKVGTLGYPPIFPRKLTLRAQQHMVILTKCIPPRVIVSVLRTWYNGWCTHRRFQQHKKSSCCFGRTRGPDSVEHYCTCARLHDFGNTWLRFPHLDDFRERLLHFLFFPTSTLLGRLSLSRPAIGCTVVYAASHRSSALTPRTWFNPCGLRCGRLLETAITPCKPWISHGYVPPQTHHIVVDYMYVDRITPLATPQ